MDTSTGRQWVILRKPGGAAWGEWSSWPRSVLILLPRIFQTTKPRLVRLPKDIIFLHVLLSHFLPEARKSRWFCMAVLPFLLLLFMMGLVSGSQSGAENHGVGQSATELTAEGDAALRQVAATSASGKEIGRQRDLEVVTGSRSQVKSTSQQVKVESILKTLKENEGSQVKRVTFAESQNPSQLQRDAVSGDKGLTSEKSHSLEFGDAANSVPLGSRGMGKGKEAKTGPTNVRRVLLMRHGESDWNKALGFGYTAVKDFLNFHFFSKSKFFTFFGLGGKKKMKGIELVDASLTGTL